MTSLQKVQDFAETKFKKREKQLAENKKVMAEHEAVRIAVNAKTDRLRALRLAHEATIVPAPAKVKSSAKRKR